MPPKKKYPKVGLQRMDAALDALTPMGFTPYLIRRKVKSLLQLYDGDQGWVFIEEAAYKMLIESLLEDQEGFMLQPGDTSCRDSTSENVCQEGLEVEQLEAGPASEPLCSDQDKASSTSTGDASLPLPRPAAVLEPTFITAPPGFEHFLPSLLNFAPSKRNPCLGWIGPKDDNDYVLLNPLPVMGWSQRQRKRTSRWDQMRNNVV